VEVDGEETEKGENLSIWQEELEEILVGSRSIWKLE